MIASVVPSELSLDWVYLPPSLLVVVLGFVATFVITRLFNRFQLSGYFWYPELAFLGIWVLLSSLTGLVFLSP